MDLKAAVRKQAVGRKRIWTVAVVVATAIAVVAIVNAWPYCDRIVHPVAFGRNFALVWMVLLLLIGLNWDGRFAVITLFILAVVLAPNQMITPRTSSNESFAAGRLLQIGVAFKSPESASQVIADVWGPDAKRSGYVLALRPDNSISSHPLVSARPSCYCRDGQRSFVLDDSGAIHYTRQDREATLRDPILK